MDDDPASPTRHPASPRSVEREPGRRRETAPGREAGPGGEPPHEAEDELAYEFTAPLWVWDARRTETWTFVSLPDDVADEILEIAGPYARGFGSLRVEVGVGSRTWRTSIFPDAKARTYVLPIKRAVRDAEGLVPDAPVTVRLRVLV